MYTNSTLIELVAFVFVTVRSVSSPRVLSKFGNTSKLPGSTVSALAESDRPSRVAPIRKREWRGVRVMVRLAGKRFACVGSGTEDRSRTTGDDYPRCAALSLLSAPPVSAELPRIGARCRIRPNVRD